MTAVRCPSCGWTGNRKSDLPPNAEHAKPCPGCEGIVLIGPPPPTKVETTPSGIEIAFWDSENIETGQPQQRRYKFNGQKGPSVSAILGILDKSQVLIPWAIAQHEAGFNWRDIRDEAGGRGRHAHDLLLRALLDERTSLSDLPDEFRAWGQAAFRWLLLRKPKVIQAECMVASVEHGFAGRFDLFAQIGFERVRVDWKTVTSWAHKRDSEGKPTDEVLPPYAENALQLDGYELAAVESGYDPADHGLVVRLGPDGEFDETPVQLDPQRFLGVLAAYRARSEANKALIAGLPDQLAVAA